MRWSGRARRAPPSPRKRRENEVQREKKCSPLAGVPSVVRTPGRRDVLVCAVSLGHGVHVACRQRIIIVLKPEGHVLAPATLLVFFTRSSTSAGSGAHKAARPPAHSTCSTRSAAICTRGGSIGAEAGTGVGADLEGGGTRGAQAVGRAGNATHAGQASRGSTGAHLGSAAHAEGTRAKCTSSAESASSTRVGGSTAVKTPQRMIHIRGGRRGVTANDAVAVSGAVDTRVQQIPAHQLLGIRDGVGTRAELAVGKLTRLHGTRRHNAPTGCCRVGLAPPRLIKTTGIVGG